MGIDEDAELIVGILLATGLLPFVMAWLESTLNEPVTPDRRPWWRRRVRRRQARRGQ